MGVCIEYVLSVYLVCIEGVLGRQARIAQRKAATQQAAEEEAARFLLWFDCYFL